MYMHVIQMYCTTYSKDSVHRLGNIEGMSPIMVGNWTIVLLHRQHPAIQSLDIEIRDTYFTLAHNPQINVNTCMRISKNHNPPDYKQLQTLAV